MIAVTKLVALSDTHERHRQIDVPDGDVLMFAGDLTMTGEMAAVKDFAHWLADLPHEHKLVIGGNHDCCFTDHRRDKAIALLEGDAGALYLQGHGTTIGELNVFGTPWTQTYNEWCLQKDEDGLRREFQRIPADTDVLVSHGPAYGTGDYLDGYGHIGSEALRDVVERVQPDLHLYGHVHQHHGRQAPGSYNVSVLDGEYNVVAEPVVIEVDSDD